MAAACLTDLTDYERRCIMLLLRTPDLLRLSATCRSFRSDLFRLMHGDLEFSVRLSLPSIVSAAPSEAAQQGRAAERSFRTFLEAGGAPLVKTLVIDVLTKPLGDSNPLHWPPLLALENLDVGSEVSQRRRNVCDIVAVVAEGIIATAPKLQEVQLCFPQALIPLDVIFQRIRSLELPPSSTWTDLYIEAETCYLPVQVGVGLPTCPPLQRLLVLADCIGLKLVPGERKRSSIDEGSQQPVSRSPAWSSIRLRPTINVAAYDPESMRVLLKCHSPEQLVILGAKDLPHLPTIFFNKDEDDLCETFMSRMTR